MHCNNCGCLLHEGEQFCPGCGRPADAARPAPKAAPAVAPPMYVAAGQPSGKATASLICGIFFFILPAAIVAIILGHIAYGEIKRSGGRLIGQGRAVAGLVLGYFGIAFIPFFLIIAAIAIPNHLRARIAANEASAMASIRTINTAQLAYHNAYPDAGYACALSELGGSEAKGTSSAAGLIDTGIASGTKNGYRFALTGCAASTQGAGYDSYVVYATPVSPKQSGMRSFCSDQTGVIKTISATSSSVRNTEIQACLENGDPL